MSIKYYYKVFNLVFESELQCPELLKVKSQSADVTIKIDSVPKHLDVIEKHRHHFESNENQVLLSIPQVGRLLVEQGKTITIDPTSGVSDKTLRLYLLGSAMGAIQHQRGRLILHANAITNEKTTLLVCGRSGAGKSTTANALLKHFNTKLLSDDLAVLDFDEKPFISPAYPQSKLWQNALDILEIPRQVKLLPIRDSIDKYALPLQKYFCSEVQSLDIIFILQPQDQPTVTVRELTGLEKINALRCHTYRKGYLIGEQLSNRFDSINVLAAKVPVYMINRPKTGNTLIEVTEMINSLTQFEKRLAPECKAFLS
jgi:hypothetical protein